MRVSLQKISSKACVGWKTLQRFEWYFSSFLRSMTEKRFTNDSPIYYSRESIDIGSKFASMVQGLGQIMVHYASCLIKFTWYETCYKCFKSIVIHESLEISPSPRRETRIKLNDDPTMPQTFSRIILSRNIHAEKSVRQKIVVVFSPRFTLAYPISGRPIKPYRPRTFLQTCQQGSLCNPASEFRLEPFEIGRPLIPLSPPILLPLSLFFLHPFHGCVTTAWETNAIDKRGGARKN